MAAATSEPTMARSSAIDTDDVPRTAAQAKCQENENLAAPHRETDPFATPAAGPTPHSSAHLSRTGSATSIMLQAAVPSNKRYFHSRRIKKGTVERPWLEKKDPREKWVTIIPLMGFFIGICLTAILVWDGLKSVANHEYCPVLILDDFSGGLDPAIWTKEAEVGGYGNGQFEETTTGEENAYVVDGMLIIKPTIVDEKIIENNATVTNLTKSGLCTAQDNFWQNCIATTNLTNSTIVNPVHSARLNTKKGAAIRYGRIEVVAQLPAGDWLWPAIWMLPANPKYGAWPASGEIDIMESRGNNYTYAQGGNNIVSSTLHWGPSPQQDGWWRNNVKRAALHTTYAKGFHTFGLEWTEEYIFTYVDSRLLQVMYNGFDRPFWQEGHFPPSDSNGTQLVDPWSWTGNKTTPFDQDFYLILNVAVGGTNHWFKDGESGKPWVDADPIGRWEFWKARDIWGATWDEHSQMRVKSVKMWQQKGYNGCGSQAKKLAPHKK